eukprot:635152-Prorocentrum_minimum.AAC.1
MAGTCRDAGVQLGVPGPGDGRRQLTIGVLRGVPAGPAGGRLPELPPVHSLPEQPLLQRRPLSERRPRRLRERRLRPRAGPPPPQELSPGATGKLAWGGLV